jgi:hypothetical protein
LGDPVGEEVAFGKDAAEEGGEGDGGIEMAAGDVSAGEDHDHEDAANGDGREGGAAADGHADGEDEEEGADEFDSVFFHGGEQDGKGAELGAVARAREA